MKKIIPILILMLLLCGCSVNADYIEPEDRVIVSAIGFQNRDNDILLTLETIDVSTTSNEDSYSTLLITGNGKSAYEAFADAESKAYGEVLFSQCPVILLGTDINPEQLNSILDYCVDSENISLAVKILASDNPFSVLSENTSKKALGHQIMNMIEYGNEVSGITKYDTFVTITNVRKNDRYAYRIPLLTSSEGLNISGAAVYLNDSLNFIADITEAQLMQMVCSKLKNSTIIYQNSVLNVKCTQADFKTENERVQILVRITVEKSKETKNLAEVQSMLNNKINSFFDMYFDVSTQILKQNYRKLSSYYFSAIDTEIKIIEEK